MKKLISIIAATAMFLGTIPAASAAETNAWANNPLDSDAVHIGIISDAHVIDADDTDNMTAAFNAFNTLAPDSLAGLILNGDIVYQFPPSGNVSTSVSDEAYDYVFNALESVFGEGYESYVWSMGNHEFPQGTSDETLTKQALEMYINKVGQADEDGNARYVQNFEGYTVIAAAAQDYYGMYSEETEAWILEQIENAVDSDSDKPIFLALHHPLQGTVMNISTQSCSEEFITKLKEYPQVINIASHMHTMAQNPATIRQDGFTSILTPYLGEIGYIEAEGTYHEGNTVSQALMLEIDPDTNIVKIYKLDVKNNKFIGNPYVIDIPGLAAGTSEEVYTDARIENSNTPTFPAGAAVSVQLAGDKAELTFPQAKNTAQSDVIEDGFVLYYKAKVINTSTDAMISESEVASGYHLASSPEEMKDTVTATISSLPEGTKCKISITPVAPFGKEGTALESKEFTTLRKGEIPTDGTALELIPAQDAVYSTPSASGYSYTTSLGTNSIAAWSGTDVDFEVYATEDGWYDIGINATNWKTDPIPVRIYVNTERAAKLDVTQTTVPNGNDIDYFEGKEFWPEATEETITYKTSEAETLTTNGHVWLTEGKNYIRVSNDANVGGYCVPLHKVLIKKNLECDDAVPTYHYYDTVNWSLSYNIQVYENGNGVSYGYSQTDNKSWTDAPNTGATVQGGQIVCHTPFKANYRICAPVSGYYKMTFRAGNGAEKVSPYNVYINSSETPAVTGEVKSTGSSYLDYEPHDFGTIYLNKGVNLLTLHQTSGAATYANAFMLELTEAKQLDAAKYICDAFNADEYYLNEGTQFIKIPNNVFADKINFGGESVLTFVVNASEAGWYNVMSVRGNFVREDNVVNVFKFEVNGEKQLETGTPMVSGSLNLEDALLGKVYLNKGANIVKVSNSVAHSVIRNITLAKADAKMYMNDAEISAVASGTLKATMALNGEKEVGSAVRAIFAIYEDGKLAAIEKTDKTLETYCDEIDVEIKDFTAKQGVKYTAKAFMWDSANSGISINLAK